VHTPVTSRNYPIIYQGVTSQNLICEKGA